MSILLDISFFILSLLLYLSLIEDKVASFLIKSLDNSVYFSLSLFLSSVIFDTSKVIDLRLLLKRPSLSLRVIKLFLISSDSLSYLFLSLINVFLLLSSTSDSFISNNLLLVELIVSSIFNKLV